MTPTNDEFFDKADLQCPQGVPWEGTLSEGRTLTWCLLLFLLVLIALFIFRVKSKGLPVSTKRSRIAVFSFSMKTCIELPAFIMQIVLVSKLFGLNTCVERSSLDIYLSSLIMTAVELISEIFIREDLSTILVFHHSEMLVLLLILDGVPYFL